LLDLIVQAPQDVLRRPGMIVLHERRAQPGLFLEDPKVKTFEEKATVVTEDLGLDD